MLFYVEKAAGGLCPLKQNPFSAGMRKAGGREEVEAWLKAG
jgi:hypothetical protein